LSGELLLDSKNLKYAMDAQDHKIEDEFASVVETAASTLQTLSSELVLVRGVCDAIAISDSLPELCTLLSSTLARSLKSQCVSLFWSTPDAPFRLQGLWSSPPLEDGFPPALAKSPIVTTLRDSRGPILIGDLSTYRTRPDTWPFPKDFVAFLMVPLFEKEKLRGILCFCDKKPFAFDEKKFLTVMSMVPPIVSTLVRFDRLK
jgi:hypothetical protein